ncbi:MAG: DUF3349 domain-containing protein [Sandaracinus sp.]|nr:DUF3349 domain-containing protein [Sandaracinus sp.]
MQPEQASPLRSTVELLRAAYPNELPASDRVVLLEVLRDIGMSDRCVAAAMGAYLGVAYESLLYEVTTSRGTISEQEKARVVEHLQKFGYDAWADEP